MSNEPDPKPSESSEPPETTTPETEPTKTEPTEGKEKALVNKDGAEPKAKESAEAEYVPLDADAIKGMLPEGMQVDEPTLASFQEIAGKHKLSEEVIKDLVNVQKDAQIAAAKATEAAWNEAQDLWIKEAKADPDVGGEKLDTTLAKIQPLLNDYGTQEFRDLLELSGAGNNVHLIKFLNKVADALPSEGKPVQGSPTGGKKPLADRMFGSSS